MKMPTGTFKNTITIMYMMSIITHIVIVCASHGAIDQHMSTPLIWFLQRSFKGVTHDTCRHIWTWLFFMYLYLQLSLSDFPRTQCLLILTECLGKAPRRFLGKETVSVLFTDSYLQGFYASKEHVLSQHQILDYLLRWFMWLTSFYICRNYRCMGLERCVSVSG